MVILNSEKNREPRVSVVKMDRLQGMGGDWRHVGWGIETGWGRKQAQIDLSELDIDN